MENPKVSQTKVSSALLFSAIEFYSILVQKYLQKEPVNHLNILCATDSDGKTNEICLNWLRSGMFR